MRERLRGGRDDWRAAMKPVYWIGSEVDGFIVLPLFFFISHHFSISLMLMSLTSKLLL